MATADQFRETGKAGGLVLLLGAFLLFCATVMFTASIWRAYRWHLVASRWIETTARVEKCWCNLYHPFPRDGGGTVYSLRCRLGYEFGSHPYEYELRTTSERPVGAQSRIEDWIAEHGPGRILTVAVNPADPHEIAVKDELPIHQFNTAKEALLTTLAFGAPGLLLTVLGRRLSTKSAIKLER